MKKKILAVIGIMTITAAMFAGCSSKDAEADAQVSTELVSQTVSVSDTTKTVESTTVVESTTNEATSTTKKKDGSTTTKKAAQTTTKAAAKTTAKQTTKSTTAVQTTKATTKATKATVKNVSAKDVQAQVNAYIRSKGVTVDSSLNPRNSGWNTPVAGRQDGLNSGKVLNSCKFDVDSNISSMGTNISMYCYLDGTDFYVCYM